MAHLVTQNQKLAFADYAEKHGIFPLFERIIQRMVVEKPLDPLQFMIELLKRPETPAVIVCGPPASGKGTLCKMLSEKLGAVHIMPDELLRAAVEKQTMLGVQAKPYLEKGQPVPDNISVGLVVERLNQEDVVNHGWFLDGFPRTREQALYLQKEGILPKIFIHLDIPNDLVIQRISGRRVDPLNGQVYHLIFEPPPTNEIAARLVRRADDREEAAYARLQFYQRHVKGLLGCYANVSRRFNADQPKVDVFEEVLSYVTSHVQRNGPRCYKVFFVGPPGSGANSMAQYIAEKYNLVYVCIRHLILAEVSAESSVSEEVKPYIHEPEKLPDETAVKLIRARLAMKDCSEKGWILSGFPRDAKQAEMLRMIGIEPNRIFYFDAPIATCMERLTLRRTDVANGRTYHLRANQDLLLIDPSIKTRLLQRPDDDEEIVQRRVEEFDKDRVKNHLHNSYTDIRVEEVDASRSFAEVQELVEHMLVH